MTEQPLRALGPALADFLGRFLFGCGYTQTFAHLGTYVRGLLSDLPRKSVEPIALQAGTPVRTLQEFLKDHAWDRAAVRDRLQQHAAQTLPVLPGAEEWGASASSTRPAPSSKGPRPPACNGSTSAVWARSRTASSPSTSAPARRATRPSSTPTCTCRRTGTRTAPAAARRASRTRWSIGRSGRSPWGNSTGARPTASAATG